MGYLQFAQLIKREIFPFKDENFLRDGTLDKPIDWVPGMSNIRFKDLPSFIRANDPNDTMFDFLGSEAQNCLTSSAIILNTFDELEHEVLDAISSKFPNIYTIGPLPLLCSRHVPENHDFMSFTSSLWKEDSQFVYVNYGSITEMTEEHLKEFAWGLANSNHPFLRIVRPDVVMGTDSVILPEEYFEEIKDRGLIVNWCPQEKVFHIQHAGVPVICWPFFAEQQTNCRYACTTWGIGIEVNHDVRDIENLVKKMLEDEDGKKMRENAIEWKKKAVEATDIGGKSSNNFDKFIEEALLCGPQ
ncbi:hypothetical protein ACOSQ3_024045 [Xanthoceras sorbifolium]